jgi:hypothetical protein
VARVLRPAYDRPVDRRRVVVSAIFYLGLAAVWLCMLFDVFHVLLPEEVATRIGYNSEGVVLAFVMAAWIQFALPRLTGTSRGAIIASAVAVGFLLLGLWLLNSDLSSDVKTLNETFIGVAIIICYIQWRRPLPPWLAPALTVAVLALMGLSIATDAGINFAETAGMCLLAPLAFDVVDKGILDRRATTSTGLRYTWYSVLIVLPVISSTLWHSEVFSPGSAAYRINNYEVRLQEAFVGIFLIELFLAVGLGRLGRRAGVSEETAPSHA